MRRRRNTKMSSHSSIEIYREEVEVNTWAWHIDGVFSSWEKRSLGGSETEMREDERGEKVSLQACRRRLLPPRSRERMHQVVPEEEGWALERKPVCLQSLCLKCLHTKSATAIASKITHLPVSMQETCHTTHYPHCFITYCLVTIYRRQHFLQGHMLPTTTITRQGTMRQRHCPQPAHMFLSVCPMSHVHVCSSP